MSRTRPNYISVIFSVALVLLLIGLFVLTAAYGNRLVEAFKEKVDIWIELQPDLSEPEVARITNLVRSQPFVKKESLSFISSEAAAAAMRKDLGDETLLADLPNLMRDVVRFNAKADFLAPDSLSEWRAQIKQDSAVADVFFEAFSVGNAPENIQKISIFLLILAFILIVGAVALIHNTIRLALYANRFVIKNQEMVGASWGFIARPYIRKGIANGIWSGVIATIILTGLTYSALNSMPDLNSIHDTTLFVVICFGLLLSGALIGGISTWWVVNKLLKMRLEDLY